MLKAEKQAIICTLYTQQTIQAWHTSRSTRLPRTRTEPPPSRKKKKPLLCFHEQSRPHGGVIQTRRNKINRKGTRLLTVIYNLCNSIYDFDIFWNHQDQSVIRYPDYSLTFLRKSTAVTVETIKKCLLHTCRNIFSHCYQDKESSTIIKKESIQKNKT